ncbi:MAG: thiamine-monophosphate kinase, partial [Planctomycetaceae bacterium]|nr:thiamine-monophosphate kinase [Planctomycetaceae bacterium]
LIRWLREALPQHANVPIPAGGDDAALLEWSAPGCVATVDVLMEGVDFRLAEVDPRRVGHKALGVNLSDLAAMAAKPRAALVGLVLPRSGGHALAVGLYEGMIPLAERYGVAIAGGDVNSWDGPLVISVTLLGEPTPRGVLRRGGAKPGDQILVTGSLGGSLLGRHLDFQPRVEEALLLNDRYHLSAGIDVSDGLATDVAHLAEESACGALLDLETIPIDPAAHRLSAQTADGQTPLDHALGDGEDFELVLAVPPAEAARLLADQPLDVRLTRIGEFIPEPGLWQRDREQGRRPLAVRGYEHRLS